MSQLIRIYENELLKGYCERLYMVNPYLTMGGLVEELFGKRVLRIHHCVPSHISRIVAGLGGYFKPEDLIQDHTLYPFYTAFQGGAVQLDIYNKMLQDNGNAYKIIKYNEIAISQYYRYCPLCIKEQLEQGGNFSWNRIHQIVPTCTKHDLWIQESTFPVVYRMDEYMKHWNHLDLQKMCKGTSIEKALGFSLDKGKKVSKVIELLITNQYSKDTTLEGIRDAYYCKLEEKGLLYPSGESIRFTELVQQMQVYFTQQLLDQMGVQIEKCITKALNKFSNVVHPLYHVLMIVFLDIDITAEIPKQKHILPDIPFYCLNPLNDHEHNHIIDDIQVHYCYDTKQHMCTFCCSCGFIFTTRVDDVIKSKGMKIGKIKQFGKVYEERILSLRHLGVKGIARKTGINHGTIRKQLRCYNQYGSIIWPVEMTNTPEVAMVLESASEVKSLTRREIVNIRPVDEEIAATHIERQEYRKVEWQKKDDKYCLLIQREIHNELTSKDRPVKITRTRLAKNIRAIHAIVYNIDKMPKTKTLIESHQETQEQYYIRKIRWAIGILSEEGEVVIGWKILKKVGCCEKNIGVVKQLITEMV